MLAVSLFSFAACGKEEPAPKVVPPPTAKTVDKPKAPPPKKELTTDQLVQRHQECWAAFNAKDDAKFAACYGEGGTAEMVDNQMMTATGGREVVDKMVKPFWAGFPDAKGEAQLTLAKDKNVVVIYHQTGTNSGAMMGMPPTNKKIGYLCAQHTAFNPDGTVQSDSHYCDHAAMMGQLGVHKAPHRAIMTEGWADKPTVIASGDPKETANVELVTKLHEAFNKRDVPGVMAGYADDAMFSFAAAPKDTKGKKDIEKELKSYYKSTSDVKSEVQSIWGAGDWVVATVETTGTNDGPMMGMKATKKPFNMHELNLYKIQDGKIKEHRIFSDGAAFAIQLGLMEDPMAKAGAAGGGDMGDPAAGGAAGKQMGDKEMGAGKDEAGAAKGKDKPGAKQGEPPADE
jgi:steroid delta-isomerase-like uncharacterized protein